MDSSFLYDQGYSLIPSEQINTCWQRLHANPQVFATADFRIQDLMAGPVVLTHKDSADMIPESESLAQHWHDFNVLSIQQLLAWGQSQIGGARRQVLAIGRR